MKIDFIHIKEFCDEHLVYENYSHNRDHFVDGNPLYSIGRHRSSCRTGSAGPDNGDFIQCSRDGHRGDSGAWSVNAKGIPLSGDDPVIRWFPQVGTKWESYLSGFSC